MSGFGDYIIPLLLGGIFFCSLCRGVDVFGTFVEGAKEGLATAVSILPSLVCLLTAVSMLRASGAMDLLIWVVRPAAALLGLPQELLPLALLRPVSGSGAMALFDSMLRQYGPDSFVGRAASVLQGSTETTFYTIAVYYGAIGIKNTRHTLAASLAGDLTGMIFSVLTVRLVLGSH